MLRTQGATLGYVLAGLSARSLNACCPFRAHLETLVALLARSLNACCPFRAHLELGMLTAIG